MSNDSNYSYKQIFKATSIFGGVQVFNIAIGIVRSKGIALLLGPAGIGIVGLFSSTTGLISSFTNFGLGTIAIRDIAEAHAENNDERIGKIIAIFRKLVWLTGGFGALLCFILSPWLSKLTFGNSNYTWSFMFLSISLLFGQLTAGQNTLLQGIRKIKYLAFANMLGSVASVFVSLPLYYFYGEDGIVPAIIIMALVTLVVSNIFSRKLTIHKVKISFSESFKQGKGMLKLGFVLSLGVIIGAACNNLVLIFINNTGSIDDVGLYTAGFQIVGTSVGLVFAAMGTDYYPRLSGETNHNLKRHNLVNQQAELAILILTPIIQIFIVFIPYFIKFLYSERFIAINDMIIWSSYSMLFKAGSWAISFLFLANGDNKIFFWSELSANVYLLCLNIMGYYYFGLTGLGYATLISNLIYFLQVYYLSKHSYSFSINKNFIEVFFTSIVICGLCIFIVEFENRLFKYTLGIFLIILGSILSIYKINKKTYLLHYIKKIIPNNRN